MARCRVPTGGTRATKHGNDPVHRALLAQCWPLTLTLLLPRLDVTGQVGGPRPAARPGRRKGTPSVLCLRCRHSPGPAWPPPRTTGAEYRSPGSPGGSLSHPRPTQTRELPCHVTNITHGLYFSSSAIVSGFYAGPMVILLPAWPRLHTAAVDAELKGPRGSYTEQRSKGKAHLVGDGRP